MSSAGEQRLPEAPHVGAGGEQTAMDCLISDLIEYLRSNGLGFPADTCKSEGMYIVRSIAKALCMILTPCFVDSAHTHHATATGYPWSSVRKNFEENINNLTDCIF